ncbi:MAG: RagB/SusD family nutrient uptake outer membrane protein [Paludibacter sp.]|nr:RagB/SusD family nutrient uptake outer membrane protein [Paludibacter sp.]
MKTKIFTAIVLGLSLLNISCSDDFLDVKTTSKLTSKDAIAAMEADPSKLEGFVNSIYSVMVEADLIGTGTHDAFGLMSILHSTDMMSEDIVQDKSTWFTYDYLHDNRGLNYRRTRVNWTYLYSVVSNANIVLSMTSPETTSPIIKAYRGQVFALRGMAYYYLIQMYQHTFSATATKDRSGIPLYYAQNEGKENRLNRVPVTEVFTQIESDLKTAVTELNGWTRGNKNQIDSYVANGLLARYYLLSKQWQKAADAAVIAAGGFSIMTKEDLHDGFMNLANREWMWGFDHNSETETRYASFFSHISNIAPGYAGLEYGARLIDKRLYESIPETDERKKLFQGGTQTIEAAGLSSSSMASTTATAWTLPYANVKFGFDGNWTMDYPYMRTAEMILIEAEALAQLNKNGEAATALKKLMVNRDATWNKTTVTVDEVWMQRRIELWGEGFSYFDLKRLNKGINRVYSGTNHRADAQFSKKAGDKTWIYQLPQAEIQENSEIAEKDNND